MGRDWIVYVERLEDIEKCFHSEGACPKRPPITLHKDWPTCDLDNAVCGQLSQSLVCSIAWLLGVTLVNWFDK